MFEVAPLLLNRGDTLDTPTDSQIDFLTFPVLNKGDTPQSIHQCIDWGERAEDYPGSKAKGCREDKELKVGLCEGKIIGNLERNISYPHRVVGPQTTYFFAKAIPYLVQILNLQESHSTPFLDPFLVERVVMQREDGLHILPLAFFWNDAGSAFVPRTGDEVVYDAKPFGLGQ